MNLLKKAVNFVCDSACSLINNTKAVAAAVLGAAAVVATEAQAAVPTEISDITTNADTVWTSVKTIIVGVVGFMVLIAFVKRVRKG